MDYLTIVGSSDARSLFTADYEKQWETLTQDKKSRDRGALISHLNTAIGSGELTELQRFWDYFVNRLRRFKDPITAIEEEALDAILICLKGNHIFVLRRGEIEDYLPPGGRDIKSIVELVGDRQWVNKVPNADARVELGQIICEIIQVGGDGRSKFLAELRSANVIFAAREYS